MTADTVPPKQTVTHRATADTVKSEYHHNPPLCLYPGAGVLACINQVELWRALCRAVVIHPSCSQWQGHEDGLNAATGLEAKGRSPADAG